MSPEQAEVAPLDVDIRSDVYSLGVILCELLLGELPYATRLADAARARSTSPRGLVARALLNRLRDTLGIAKTDADALERDLQRDTA